MFATFLIVLMKCILASAVAAGGVFICSVISTKDSPDFNVGFEALGLAVFLFSFLICFANISATTIVYFALRNSGFNGLGLTALVSLAFFCFAAITVCELIIIIFFND